MAQPLSVPRRVTPGEGLPSTTELLVASFKKTSSRKDANQIRRTNQEKLKGNKMQRTDGNFLEINEYYHRDWRKYIYENKSKTLINEHSENYRKSS